MSIKSFNRRNKEVVPEGCTDIFPILKPGNWPGLGNMALFDTLLAEGDNIYLVKANGSDLVTEFRFLTELDLKHLKAETIRKQAKKNIENHKVQIRALEQLEGQVLLIEDDSFAAEKIFDADFMKQTGEQLGTQDLIVSVARRGFLMIAPQRLQEYVYDAFIQLHCEAYSKPGNLAPITDLVLVYSNGRMTSAMEVG